MRRDDLMSARFDKLMSALVRRDGVTSGSLPDLTIGSHFQPIYSLSHGRVVGHEALMRARDANGTAISPMAVFARCDTPNKLAWCDSLSRVVHMSNFAEARPPDQWLFLNMNPVVFAETDHVELISTSQNALAHFGLQAQQIVVEVLEDAISDQAKLLEAAQIARRMGFLLALDDFGAGHSNFDRVWRLQPDIVKLDRSLVNRAASDRRSQRMVAQMVSLLHECGSLVLMEGIETMDEALVALDSDADLVQGYYFARPAPQLLASHHYPPQLTGLHEKLNEHRNLQRGAQNEFLAPYVGAIYHAATQLATGRPMPEACATFIALPQADTCYLLDADGRQIDQMVWSNEAASSLSPAFAPLHDATGAVWSRRPYFRRAVDAPGKVQVTRPYRTLQGGHVCITASVAFTVFHDGRPHTRVVCGDFRVADWPQG